MTDDGRGATGRGSAPMRSRLDDAGRILLCRIAPSIVPGDGLDAARRRARLRRITEVARPARADRGDRATQGEVIELADASSHGLHRLRRRGRRVHAIQIVYRVRITGGELRDEIDGSTDTCAWFTLERSRPAPPRRARATRRSAAADRGRLTMHSTIGIDVAAPPALVFAARPRRGALGAAAPPLRPVAGGRRAPGGWLARRRLRRRAGRSSTSSGSRSRSRGAPAPGHEPATLPPPLRPRRRCDQGDGRDLADRAGCRVAPVSRSTTTSGRAVPLFAVIRRPVLHPADRGPDARHVQRPRRGARRTCRPTTPMSPGDPLSESTTMTATVGGDGSGSPGSASSPPIGTGRDAFRAGLREGRSPVKRIDRFDPSPVPLAGRGAGRRLRPARLDAAQDRAPARPLQPVRARRGSARARRREADAGRERRRASAADRDLPRLRARRHRLRRGAARALSREGHPPGRAEPRAGGLRWRGAGQPRDRARRPRPDPVDRQLVRVGSGRARRGDGRPARRPDRCRDRRWRRDPAEPARVRRVRHHPGAVGRPQRRARHGRAAVRSRAATGS